MSQIINLRNKKNEEKTEKKPSVLVVPKTNANIKSKPEPKTEKALSLSPAGGFAGQTIQKEERRGRISAEHFATDKRWAAVICVSMTAIGLLYLLLAKNVIAAVLFFLITSVLLILSFKEKKGVDWKINQRELTVGISVFPFSELKSFWIEYRPGQLKELSFQSKKWYYPYIKIPLTNENPLALRDFLLDILPEEKHTDTIVEVITRKLGM